MDQRGQQDQRRPLREAQPRRRARQAQVEPRQQKKMRPEREMPAQPVEHRRRQREQRRTRDPRQRMRGEQPDQLPRQHRLQRAAGKQPQSPILRDLHDRVQRLEQEGEQRDRIGVEDGGPDLEPPIGVQPRRPGPGAALEEGVAQPILHRVRADGAGQHPAGMGRRQHMQAEAMRDHRRADQRGDDPAEAVEDLLHRFMRLEQYAFRWTHLNAFLPLESVISRARAAFV